ncbi:MAG TPA: glycoside hydrolase family 36 protein, partial [Anaerolineales bacterium]
FPGGFILNGNNVSLQIPPGVRSYYSHGWQSWSLAAWTSFKPLPAPKPALMTPMQVDPVYAKHPSPNGSWVGAVDYQDGNILLLGALGLESHVQLRDGELQGWYNTASREAAAREWFVGYGAESQVFDTYAQLLGQRFGTHAGKPAPRVWCSWYSLYQSIDEKKLNTIFSGLGELPFDVLQIDDGWQISIGDWQPNKRFPAGMDGMAESIRATGRRAGLWLAPLLVVPSSRTYRDHPEWLLVDELGIPVPAGFNWGERLYALDTTHPEVLNWLTDLVKQVRAWGYDYVKLDFLYAGALPGKRHVDTAPESAYRQALKQIRLALGEEAYFLTCGAPVIPSLGLCDAMRVGPDVASIWESQRDAVLLHNSTTPGTRNAIRTSLNRLWLAGLVQPDPDVAYFNSIKTSLTPKQKSMLQDLALVCNFRATSDLPEWLAETERKALLDFLTSQPEIERTGRYTFRINGREVDFSPAMLLPDSPRGLSRLIGELTGWLGNQPAILNIFTGG